MRLYPSSKEVIEFQSSYNIFLMQIHIHIYYYLFIFLKFVYVILFDFLLVPVHVVSPVFVLFLIFRSVINQINYD